MRRITLGFDDITRTWPTFDKALNLCTIHIFISAEYNNIDRFSRYSSGAYIRLPLIISIK